MSSEYKTTAVLFSGGLDSAVLLADALARGPRGSVLPLYVSAGLAWEPEERAMMQRLFARAPFAGSATPIELTFDMSDVLTREHWSIKGTPPAFDTPDADVYLPGRNIILLSKAAVYLASSGRAAHDAPSRILMGQLAGNPFPDATPDFITAITRALSLGVAATIAIETPFVRMHKDAVIRMGVELEVPLELTLSCMKPRRGKHCGECSKCRERRDAFAAAGIDDPAPYATRPIR